MPALPDVLVTAYQKRLSAKADLLRLILWEYVLFLIFEFYFEGQVSLRIYCCACLA